MSGVSRVRQYPAFAPGMLADVIAQVVHFGVSDFVNGLSEPIVPQSSQWTMAFVVSCLLAQHTIDGDEGVDTETGMLMEPGRDMPFDNRRMLAEGLVRQWGGESVKARVPGFPVEVTDADIESFRAIEKDMGESAHWYSSVPSFEFRREQLRRWLEARS